MWLYFERLSVADHNKGWFSPGARIRLKLPLFYFTAFYANSEEAAMNWVWIECTISVRVAVPAMHPHQFLQALFFRKWQFPVSQSLVEAYFSSLQKAFIHLSCTSHGYFKLCSFLEDVWMKWDERLKLWVQNFILCLCLTFRFVSLLLWVSAFRFRSKTLVLLSDVG